MKVPQSISLLALMLCCSTAVGAGDNNATSSSKYLFTYFLNESPGIRMAWSSDGLKWNPVNSGEPILSIAARDPSITKGADGVYYLAYSTGRHSVALRSSPDLVNWTDPWRVSVMENEPNVRNSWAPELFHDVDKKQVMLLWSSTVPGKFPETDETGDDGYNHRCYYKTSKDMRSWSETKLLQDPGFNNIDATIIRNGSRYMLVLKDETLKPVKKCFALPGPVTRKGLTDSLGLLLHH